MKSSPYEDDSATFKEEFSRNDDGSMPPKMDDTPAVTQKAEMAKDSNEYASEWDKPDAEISKDVAKLPKMEPKAEEAPAAKAKSFKEAFAENRKAGAKEFEWNGKKYNTAVAGEKAKGAVKAPPSKAAAKNMGKDVTVLPDAPPVVVTAKREDSKPAAVAAAKPSRPEGQPLSNAIRDAGRAVSSAFSESDKDVEGQPASNMIRKAGRAVGKFFESAPREQVAQSGQTRK